MTEPTPIMGGGGHGSGNSRVIVVFEKLPDRREVPMQERMRLLDGDIRDAMARGARGLVAAAQKYVSLGFTWDLETTTYDIAHIGEDGRPSREALPTVVCTLRIHR